MRMALHAGEAVPRDDDYLAAPLNRLARLLAAGHGTQIVLTEVVERLTEGGTAKRSQPAPAGYPPPPRSARAGRGLSGSRLGTAGSVPSAAKLASPSDQPLYPPTSLIGRGDEVAALLAALASGLRLLTLTGPGGTGKTRLAMEIGTEALDRYPDGVFFVDLAPLTDPALVIPTIATTLGVREVVSQPLFQTLSGFLMDKRMLLLLDNFERLLAAAPDVGALLATSPQLAVLATSRGSAPRAG